jgi:2-polyprenyl-3-methyl-5-hydroxy-6-metoxy-1,4-benzoquinol methylase
MTDHDTSLTDRQAREAAVYNSRFEDLAARAGAAELAIDPVHPPYPNREHIEFLDDIFALISPLDGKRLLEVGCGTGALAVYSALRGATVVGLDVSNSALEIARKRAEVNGVADRSSFVASPIETFAEPDGSFDVVLGNQVLHHFELDEAMANVRRLLAPDGVAIFCEPVLLLPDTARRVRNSAFVLRHFPSRADTPDERSIGAPEAERICKAFGRADTRAYQLFSRLQNFVELSDPVFGKLEQVDRWLLANVRPSRRLCRYMTFALYPGSPHPGSADRPAAAAAASGGAAAFSPEGDAAAPAGATHPSAAKHPTDAPATRKATDQP